ncbi:hypothetical protein [Natrinema sp. SYSU A 869]|uniref:hypothetical protein n=1 Tax=Natrinema sp. SYSU A 869 TaxID=2871694 RepID=UPI001CA3B1DF|nr:hypothetical protein [Natrinema sp. SYSU A 869]
MLLLDALDHHVDQRFRGSESLLFDQLKEHFDPFDDGSGVVDELGDVLESDTQTRREPRDRTELAGYRVIEDRVRVKPVGDLAVEVLSLNADDPLAISVGITRFDVDRCPCDGITDALADTPDRFCSLLEGGDERRLLAARIEFGLRLGELLGELERVIDGIVTVVGL